MSSTSSRRGTKQSFLIQAQVWRVMDDGGVKRVVDLYDAEPDDDDEEDGDSSGARQ